MWDRCARRKAHPEETHTSPARPCPEVKQQMYRGKTLLCAVVLSTSPHVLRTTHRRVVWQWSDCWFLGVTLLSVGVLSTPCRAVFRLWGVLGQVLFNVIRAGFLFILAASGCIRARKQPLPEVEGFLVWILYVRSPLKGNTSRAEELGGGAVGCCACRSFWLFRKRILLSLIHI